MSRKLAGELFGQWGVQTHAGIGRKHVDVVLTQRVDDDGLAPVHQVGGELENLPTAGAGRTVPDSLTPTWASGTAHTTPSLPLVPGVVWDAHFLWVHRILPRPALRLGHCSVRRQLASANRTPEPTRPEPQLSLPVFPLTPSPNDTSSKVRIRHFPPSAPALPYRACLPPLPAARAPFRRPEV